MTRHYSEEYNSRRSTETNAHIDLRSASRDSHPAPSRDTTVWPQSARRLRWAPFVIAGVVLAAILVWSPILAVIFVASGLAFMTLRPHEPKDTSPTPGVTARRSTHRA